MEKGTKKHLDIEGLLAGTPLLAFLQELDVIDDDEIVDDLSPIRDDESVIGEMMPLEKRVNAWYDRQRADLKRQEAEFRAADKCSECMGCESFDASSPCAFLRAAQRDADARFQLLWDSIRHRIPEVAFGSIGIRQGFRIVKNVKPRATRNVGFSVVDIADAKGMAKFFALLAASGTRS